MKTLQTELIDKGLSQVRTAGIEQKDTRTRDKREKRLTARDWAELMGTNRPTYGKVKGRVKQR